MLNQFLQVSSERLSKLPKIIPFDRVLATLNVLGDVHSLRGISRRVYARSQSQSPPEPSEMAVAPQAELTICW
jgi:hypothetical protein